MIGSLEVMHELIFTIPSVIQVCSIDSIRLGFNFGKPRVQGKHRERRMIDEKGNKGLQGFPFLTNNYQ